MTVDRYEAQLTGSTEMELRAGDVVLQCDFEWNEAVQEQYDALIRETTLTRDQDPLSDALTLDRTYSLFDYYLSEVPSSYAAIAEWLSHSPKLPVSIRALGTEDEQILELQSRRVQVAALEEWKAQLEECLVWQVKITDAEGGITVADVRNGGVIRGEDLSWFVTFVSPDEEITQDRLDMVTAIVEVKHVEE